MRPNETALLAAAHAGNQDEVARLAALIDADQAHHQARLSVPGALLAAALWYAGHDIAVFPCAPGGKRPATTHGFKDATTNTDQIRAWWKLRPDYNIGLPTGRNFDVIDIDGTEGLIALGDLLDQSGICGQGIYDRLECRALAHTPRGRHYFVSPDERGNGAALLPSVDYRGIGGYVVAPPSATPDGNYRWSTIHPPNLTDGT